MHELLTSGVRAQIPLTVNQGALVLQLGGPFRGATTSALVKAGARDGDVIEAAYSGDGDGGTVDGLARLFDALRRARDHPPLRLTVRRPSAGDARIALDHHRRTRPAAAVPRAQSGVDDPPADLLARRGAAARPAQARGQARRTSAACCSSRFAARLQPRAASRCRRGRARSRSPHVPSRVPGRGRPLPLVLPDLPDPVADRAAPAAGSSTLALSLMSAGAAHRAGQTARAPRIARRLRAVRRLAAGTHRRARLRRRPASGFVGIGVVSLTLNTLRPQSRDDRRRMVIILSGTLALPVAVLHARRLLHRGEPAAAAADGRGAGRADRAVSVVVRLRGGAPPRARHPADRYGAAPSTRWSRRAFACCSACSSSCCSGTSSVRSCRRSDQGPVTSGLLAAGAGSRRGAAAAQRSRAGDAGDRPALLPRRLRCAPGADRLEPFGARARARARPASDPRRRHRECDASSADDGRAHADRRCRHRAPVRSVAMRRAAGATKARRSMRARLRCPQTASSCRA